MLRLAIVGIGGYGWGLAEAIRQLSDRLDCRLVAAADARLTDFPDRARQLSEAGVELFGDARAMFAALRGKCDAVYVATGIGSHAPLAIAAARAGYCVHVEKPPAATVQEIDAMLEAFRAAGRFCMVGFQALHSRDMNLLKDRVASGRLGRVKSLACRAGWPRDRTYYSRNEWAGRLRSGGAWVLDGPAMNALAHQVANMLFIASPEPARLATPAGVRAELYAAGPVESHSIAAIEIQTLEGPKACFLASHCSEGTFGPIIEIEAERGRATWDMRGSATIVYGDGSEETFEADEGSCRDRMISDFLTAVRAGDPSGLCGELSVTRPFVLALDGAHESSGRIHRVDTAFTRLVEEGTPKERVVVEGIDEMTVRAAAGRCLFSDLADAPPWAAKTQPYSMEGYGSFPQRFAENADSS